MTQVQVGTSTSFKIHLQRQMQSENADKPSPLPSNPQQMASNSAGREENASLGQILRNNSLPDRSFAQQQPGAVQAQRRFGEFTPAVNDSRRASAFTTQTAFRKDSDIPTPLAGPDRRFSDFNNSAQSTMQPPWNTDSSNDAFRDAKPYERLNAFTLSKEASTEDSAPSLRRGVTTAWNSNTAQGLPEHQSTSLGRPSLAYTSGTSSSRVFSHDQMPQGNDRAIPNGSRLPAVSVDGRDAPPMSAGVSSNGSQLSSHQNVSAIANDIDNHFRRLNISNGIYHPNQPRNGSAYDMTPQISGQGRMSRVESSPGLSNQKSDLSWKDSLSTPWGQEYAARPTSNGELSTAFATNGIEDTRVSSMARPDPMPQLQLPPWALTNSRNPRIGDPAESVSPLRMTFNNGESTRNHEGRTQTPDFRPFEPRNNIYIPSNLQEQTLPAPGSRNAFQPANGFIGHNGMFNLPPELASSAMGFVGPQFGRQWPNGPYTGQVANNIPYLAEQDPSKVWRSVLLEDFRASSKSGRRWELKDVYDHVVEFAGDQHGSRFLQDKLKTANSEEKDRVFQEILPNAIQLMKDVFGNYVLQKFFEHGDQIQKAALVDKMKGHVYALSTQTYACRVVQKALSHILVQQQFELLKELDGKIMDCIKCENGNHVIQIAIEHVPLEHVSFMVNAIQHDVQYLSMHKYGCRIIQRLLEFARTDVLSWLIPELHKCCNLLIADQYGNYVPAHIVERGTPDDRNRVIEVVQRNLFQFSKQKFASHVVEKCIRHGTDQHRRDFMRQLCRQGIRGENELEHLIRDGFANYVVQSLLETLQHNDYLHFCRVLQPALDRARHPSPNKQAENVARKMNRFDRGLMYPPQRPYMPGPTWDHRLLV